MSESNLYRELAEKIMMGHSERIWRLFEIIADEKEAGLLLAMPGTLEELADATERPLKEVKQSLDVLFKKGLAFVSGSSGKYRMCRDTGQFHDASILWPDAPQKFFALWREFTREEWGQTARAITEFLGKAPMRVIPVEATLEAKNQILHYENVKEIIENARRVAVTKCTCRVVDGACGLPVEVCVQLNRGADYSIARGSGREITKREALEIMKQAEEAGLVHVTMNTDHSEHFICNCCFDCCIGLGLIRSEGGAKFVSPSRFQAVVDADACIGCESCIEQCHFGALSMNDASEEATAEVNGDKCLGCGLCAVVCPSEAIGFVEVRPADFIPRA